MDKKEEDKGYDENNCKKNERRKGRIRKRERNKKVRRLFSTLLFFLEDLKEVASACKVKTPSLPCVCNTDFHRTKIVASSHLNKIRSILAASDTY